MENTKLDANDDEDDDVITKRDITSAASSTASTATSAGKEEAFQVLVRVRPPLGKEISQEQAVDVVDDKSIKLLTEKHEVTCSYDKVLSGNSSQSEIYEIIAPRVRAVLSGMNSTIFAYGQTSSGKTYTMLGKDLESQMMRGTPISETDTDDWGVMPRAIVDIFTCLNDDKEMVNREKQNGDDDEAFNSTAGGAVVHCSYMQIYNNKLYDLLADPSRSNKLQIRESANGRNSNPEIFVQGLSEYRVTSASDVLLLLQHGSRNRAVRATQYNEQSSRSHAILQMTVETSIMKKNGGRVVRVAKLNCVDLAGSEKWNTRVNMKKKHEKELKEINTSLSALGNCIQRLTKANVSHVPYRDSVLTRLLEDSLGGNTKTCIIATIAPTKRSAEHTLSTLQFADRARQVMVRVKPNQIVDNKQKLISAEREIARLKNAIEGLRMQLKDAGVEPRSFDQVVLRQENQHLKEENEELRRELEYLKHGGNGKKTRRNNNNKRGNRKKMQGKKKKKMIQNNRVNIANVYGSGNSNSNSTHHQQHHGKNLPVQTSQHYYQARPPVVSQIPRLPQVNTNSADNLIELKSARSSNQEEDQFNNNSSNGLRHDQVGSQNKYSNGSTENNKILIDNLNDFHSNDNKNIINTIENADDDNNEDDDEYASDFDSMLDESNNSSNNNNIMGGVGVLADRLDERADNFEKGIWNDDQYKDMVGNSDTKGNNTNNAIMRERDVPESNTPQPKNASSILSDMLLNNPTLRKENIGKDAENDDRNSNKNNNNKQGKHPYAQTQKTFFNETSGNGNATKRGKKKKKKKKKGSKGAGKNNNTLTQGLPQELEALHNQMMQDVGKRLRVYHARYDEWYKGTIVGIDAERQMHCIEYDHGERRWNKMSMRKYQLLRKKNSQQ